MLKLPLDSSTTVWPKLLCKSQISVYMLKTSPLLTRKKKSTLNTKEYISLAYLSMPSAYLSIVLCKFLWSTWWVSSVRHGLWTVWSLINMSPIYSMCSCPSSICDLTKNFYSEKQDNHYWETIGEYLYNNTLLRFNITDLSIAFIANNSPVPWSSTKCTLQ